MSNKVHTEHHWSGWPGAFCLHCGADDPMEAAIASGDYDPYTRAWRTAATEGEYKAASICCTTQEMLNKCPQCRAKNGRRKRR